ncbi:MFS transporter [Rathayibacter sp. VKM Ac-2803]|uniref:MFS transporter n=1 Tax=Rathayibacter sp. VKM Ac-2803 TaxID=2609256 RepID=UPI00135717D6|nr:MFS transporter [Rathayibacter sp. VKM Ac-2803]MWV48818.1 MFS transporter [Rathayibacter sp. VKM Ac-2803]
MTTDPRLPRRKRDALLWPGLLPLALAQVAASTAAGLVLTIASVTALTLSGSEQIAGLVQTSTVVGASALTVPIARLTLRFGRRAALAVAYGTAALGSVIGAAAVAADLWVLFLAAAALIGGGTVAGLAARFAAADLAPRDTAVAIALVLWASTVGSIVGPNLAGATGLASAPAFLLPAVLYGSAAACVVVGLRRTEVATTPQRRESARTADVIAVFLAHPRAVAGLAVTAAVHATMIALMTMAPVHLHHEDEPTGVVGLLMSAHLAAMYALSPLFGLLVRRAGALRSGAAGLGVAVVAGGVLAVGASRGAVVFALGLTLLGIAWSLGMVAGSTLVTEAIGPRERTLTQGATDLLINLGGGVASVVAGSVVASAGYAPLAWGFAAAVALAAVVLLAAVARRTRAAPS